jgi:hypothetical protein
MPRARGKDARTKGSSTGTQLEQAAGPGVRSRAPQKQLSRQEKRRRIDEALHADADRHGVDNLNAHAQSVGKHPKGRF